MEERTREKKRETRMNEGKICPRCGRLMSKRKKIRHYWKCRRKGQGCGAILKSDGSVVVKKLPKKKRSIKI